MRAVIAVIAPEPVPWLDTVIRAAGTVGRVDVLAPWAIRTEWRRMPARVRPFIARRMVQGGEVSAVPGWPLGEAALRAWVAGRADRHMRARFAVRHAVDMLAASWLRQRHRAMPDTAPRLVIAPSCAAQRVFAVAHELGAIRFLLEDIPAIRELHRDLDAAARVHPGCVFLRRFRAADRVLIRQEVERVLADYTIVRGVFARSLRERAGFAPDRVIDLPEPADDSAPTAIRPDRAGPEARVLLAGIAAARHGTVEALAAIASRPHITLVVRPGEGTEPKELLQHPRVRSATAAERNTLMGIDAVLAPAWCEVYLPEVGLAARLGVPVIATRRAAGFLKPRETVAPGDASALGRAMDDVLGQVQGSATPDPMDAPGLASSAFRSLGDALARACERVSNAEQHPRRSI